MTDFVIIVIIIAVIAIVIVYTIKHFRGEGGCCGGGSYRLRRKKLDHVRYRKIFSVAGMHCEHCRSRVEEVVNDIDGVAGVVNLKKGELIVSYAEDVSDELIMAKIRKAGYEVKAAD